ncbi:MAG TPA: biotin carboxylase N-terminal domain-containing protein [Limnobacter sp.]|uniref:acetyl/propionyl/methylcrotonyl-CoA carboxylase subunit alpha n=1 Tax=Limnobacter sp. TaxID=2003368 RepID=UPI002ED7FFFD
MPKIRKLLVANRNEIARRILRAARPLGIATVAVYSEADSKAMHVQEADEAYCIGPAPSLDSYLRIDKLIEVAKACGADAIHPGYGFVSENPLLATACAEAGITLVGPTAQAIADMADKARAKQIAQAAGLPCIPGFSDPAASVEELMQAAERIGYPVMIKALAGGGGRGMRLVLNAGEFASQLHSAQLEAKNAFNDDRVMLEKAILNPRHIEIQVLADTHGHAVHLGERDCSVQRRHQKIVEEAPSPAVNGELRARMGEAALKLVKATQYVGAGTVEFLLDATGAFYFIEMNTRLQVEHGVTEAITGLDIVQWQLRIAAGEPLTIDQSDVAFTGHAIQGRLCAEDPARDFMPQTGPVLAWQPNEYARTDHAVVVGGEVSPWYDSLLAKVIVHAPNRLEACERLADALNRTVLVGFEHNALYLQRICSHPVFQSGEFGTGFLADNADTLLSPQGLLAEKAVAAVYLAQHNSVKPNWPASMTGFSSTRALVRPLRLEAQGKAMHVRVAPQVDGAGFELLGLTEAEPLHVHDWLAIANTQGVEVQCSVQGHFGRFLLLQHGQTLWVKQHLNPQALCVQDKTLVSTASAGDGVFQPLVKSPMNGKITQVLVEPGQMVEAGQVLVCLEAMKMEHRIAAKAPAVVEQVLVQVGAQMGLNQTLVQLKPLQ